MKRAAGLMVGISLGSSLVQAAPLSPQDFAFGLPVITNQEAAAYRFSLPLTVYQDSAREDLGDIRLFNAAGVAVPFSLLRPGVHAPIHKPVLAEPAESLAAPERATLEVWGEPDPVNANDYLFDLAAHAPVSRVNVVLPDVNTTVGAELSSRRTAKEPWRFVTRAGFYRLKTADAEQQNAPLEVGVDEDRYWRARITNSAGPPPEPLRLHVEWVPNEITFLAQGQGPFLLAYGNSTATRAEADLSQIPATVQVAAAAVGSRRVLGGSTRLVGKPAAFPWMRAVLWSVLLLAVVLLAWMAYRLANEPGR
jgi:hypothetical protein